MEDKSITIVVSDLHLGGGKADSGDDHVYQDNQFRNFILTGIPESKNGDVELFINGDFLEFAQVKPEVYTLGSPQYWCSQDESLLKLEAIIAGHSDIFEALKEFQAMGNRVTISAGNHDVDFYWDAIQTRLRDVIGPIDFELGQVWYYRYNNRMMIGHGHMFDPANKFDHWENPILKGPSGIPRLEMCPGTLFMAKFVNWLEELYPFADNLKPVTALFRLLYKEDRINFKAALGTLFHFAKDYPLTSVAIEPSDISNDDLASAIGKHLLQEINLNDKFADGIADLYQKIGRLSATRQFVREDLRTKQEVFSFIAELVIKLSPEQWLPALDITTPVKLSIGEDEQTTLSIMRSGMSKDKENLRKEAGAHLIYSNREVVVCGHTHQPDEWRGSTGTWDGGYFNPGSWTRYVEINKAKKLTLEDLKREQDFPYQLNYIRVERTKAGVLRADKICYDKAEGLL